MILRANLPTLVPPNFCTTQLPFEGPTRSLLDVDNGSNLDGNRDSMLESNCQLRLCSQKAMAILTLLDFGSGIAFLCALAGLRKRSPSNDTGYHIIFPLLRLPLVEYDIGVGSYYTVHTP